MIISEKKKKWIGFYEEDEVEIKRLLKRKGKMETQKKRKNTERFVKKDDLG